MDPPTTVLGTTPWSHSMWWLNLHIVVLGPTNCGAWTHPLWCVLWSTKCYVLTTRCGGWTHPLLSLDPPTLVLEPSHSVACTHPLWCPDPPTVVLEPTHSVACTHQLWCLDPSILLPIPTLWYLDPPTVVLGPIHCSMSLEKGHKCLILPSWNGNHCCGWKHLTRFVVIICCAIANFSRMWNALK